MADPYNRAFRFPLRYLLLYTVVAALICNYVLPYLNCYWHETRFRFAAAIIALFAAASAYALGDVSSYISCHTFNSRASRISCYLLACVAIGLFIYLVWADRRWEDIAAIDAGNPWFCPDALLLQFHDWLDERNPTPPGLLKFDGEFYAVRGWLRGFEVCAISLAFFFLGMAVPESLSRAKATLGLVGEGTSHSL